MRDDLRKDLETVSRTAASMGMKEFFMPRGKGDRAIADVARIFAKLAEPVKRNSSPITAIATARAEALAALTRLDPIMDNLLWDNPR